MDFAFTKEQEQLRERARTIIMEEIEPWAKEIFQRGDSRALCSKTEILDRFGKLTQLGYADGLFPKEIGGGGLDYVTYGMLSEELSRTHMPPTFLDSQFLPLLILDFGSDQQKKEFLPDIISFKKITGFALSEPEHGSDLAGMETNAVLDGSHYILNGTKHWVGNGPIADSLLVVAATEKKMGSKGISTFIVEKDVSPWENEDYYIPGGMMGRIGKVVFHNCRVPKGNLIGQEGEGYRQTLKRLAPARALFAAQACGIAGRSVEEAIKWAKERHQFGKPIASFQLIQEMIADMIIETDCARLLTYRALSMLDRGLHARKEASMAKVYATEAALRVTRKAVQVCGSWGVSMDGPVSRFFINGWYLAVPDGTSEIQRLTIGREVLGISAIT